VLCTKAMSKKVEKIAGEVNMNLMELNFYLWYVKTGKVLKRLNKIQENAKKIKI